MVDSQQPHSPGARPFPWLWVIAGLVLLFGMVAYLSNQNSNAEYERSQRRRESESFQRIKSGESQVTVYGTPEILVMLADDPDCVQNLKSVYFFIADLNDPRYTELSKLTSVHEITIYDCQGVETFLKAIGGMPSIETLSFESIRIDDGMPEQLSSFPSLKKVHFERELDVEQIERLKRVIPYVEIEAIDSISGNPVQIQGGTP